MLITPAFAQAAAGGDANSMLMSLLPFALIFVIMYFLILRPQQKRVKDHAEWSRTCAAATPSSPRAAWSARSPKWSTTTRSSSRFRDGVRIRQMRQMITDVRAKGEPVKEKADAKAKSEQDDASAS